MSPFMTLTLILLQMMMIIIVVAILLLFYIHGATSNYYLFNLFTLLIQFNSENSGSGSNILAKTTHSVYLEIYFSKVLKSHCVPSKHNNFSLFFVHFYSSGVEFKMLVHALEMKEHGMSFPSRPLVRCNVLVNENVP